MFLIERTGSQRLPSIHSLRVTHTQASTTKRYTHFFLSASLPFSCDHLVNVTPFYSKLVSQTLTNRQRHTYEGLWVSVVGFNVFITAFHLWSTLFTPFSLLLPLWKAGCFWCLLHSFTFSFYSHASASPHDEDAVISLSPSSPSHAAHVPANLDEGRERHAEIYICALISCSKKSRVRVVRLLFLKDLSWNTCSHNVFSPAKIFVSLTHYTPFPLDSLAAEVERGNGIYSRSGNDAAVR